MPTLLRLSLLATLLIVFPFAVSAQDFQDEASLNRGYASKVQPLLKILCFECHSGDTTEAEVDLDAVSYTHLTLPTISSV